MASSAVRNLPSRHRSWTMTAGSGKRTLRLLRVVFSLRGTQAGGLAAQLAQIVELGAANAAGAQHFNLIDHRRVHRKNSFHAMAERNLPDGEGGMVAGAALSDHGTFEDLDSFLVAFFDFDVDPDRIPGLNAVTDFFI